ncbi:MAG: hypothetical protein HKN71_09590 [Gemmatimonadetes bacterium]|nr:hypothetical protein [Gemmatimonadota bacterium]
MISFPLVQSTSSVADAGASDPLFIAAVVGSLAFLWMLIRFIVDDVDLAGDAEDLAPRLSGLAKRESSKREGSKRAPSHDVVPLARDTADEGRTRPDGRPIRPRDPRRPDRRRRPAA